MQTHKYKMRRVATVTLWKSLPVIPGVRGANVPTHAPFLEIHLMGVERGMYRGDIVSGRFERAIAIEDFYKHRGLVIEFGLN